MKEEAVINFSQWRKPKPFGISGCFRLRNEVQFMEAAVNSFLPYLDEAVLVVQPSNDNTVELACWMAAQNPEKVKVFYYPHVVDWIDTHGFYSKDPEEPGHLVHLSNYALSKCTYSWICKVEGDVIALSTVKRIIDRVKAEPNVIRYYGMVILNIAGRDFDKFSRENPRNGGYDEAVFNNNPDVYRFYRCQKWETINVHDQVCNGWSAIHLKRCKQSRIAGWNGETYEPLTKPNLARALDAYNRDRQAYPGPDDPHGIDELFDDEWRRWL